MPRRQAVRRAELSRLVTKLAKIDGADAAPLLGRFDTLISEAAAVDRIDSPRQAVASLEIALHAMGADPHHPRPEERLIMMAAAFLRTLAACLICDEVMMSPSVTGLGVIVGKIAGLT